LPVAHHAIDQMDTISTDGEEMLLLNDKNLNIVGFATRNNLKFLSECKKFFIDGTLKYCPRLFYQLVTIHTVKNGEYVPLVYLLLPNKSEDTYVNAFLAVVTEAQKLGFLFQPKSIVCDFEVGLQNAIKLVWPSADLVVCRFHVTQAWWRKMQELGLQTAYYEQGEVGRWLQWIFGLPLLSPEDSVECFTDEFMSCIPDDDRIVKFVDYMYDTYMKDGARFPSTCGPLWKLMTAPQTRARLSTQN